jgi:transcriptional regulator with XRE-family HTH domain/tetratricopeptide (TPR) repeat protein
MAPPNPGELIYQERRRRGWSKARLCDEIQSWEYRNGNGDVLGLNPNYVREWETGKRSVSDYYAPKLAAVLGIPIEAFVDRRTRRARPPAPSPSARVRPASAITDGVDQSAAAQLAVAVGMRDRLLQQWGDLLLLGPLGQRLLAKILDPKRSLIVHRRTWLKLLGASSVAAMLELLPGDAAAAAPPLRLEPTTLNTLESLAMRYQTMYHSTPPAELLVPVTAHLETVDDLAKGASGEEQRRLLRNHSQVALLAGRLSFFDLRDPMGARGYYGMALDAAREAGDPHLSAVTLGHMSFVSATGGGFTAALDLLEGADRYASKLTILPSWLAAVEAEIRAKAGQTRTSLDAIDRAENALVVAHEVPAWMDYYDRTRLNGFKGFAYLAAGRPDEARTALSEALDALDTSAVKQRAVFLTDLATIHVHEGEIDQGANLAGEAAVELTRAGYATSKERLQEFRDLVQPWQDRASVKELDERLALI